MAEHASHSGHTAEHHIVPIKYYIGVFLLLMVFTIITVLVARLNLGTLNVLVALTVAVIKATAVVLIFMHVWWSSKLTKVIVVSGIFWLIIMLTFTLSDYITRAGWPTRLGQ